MVDGFAWRMHPTKVIIPGDGENARNSWHDCLHLSPLRRPALPLVAINETLRLFNPRVPARYNLAIEFLRLRLRVKVP
jgi:hypothetical protein